VNRQGQGDYSIPRRQRPQKRRHVQPEGDGVGDTCRCTDEVIQINPALDRHAALTAAGIIKNTFRFGLADTSALASLTRMLACPPDRRPEAILASLVALDESGPVAV